MVVETNERVIILVDNYTMQEVVVPVGSIKDFSPFPEYCEVRLLGGKTIRALNKFDQKTNMATDGGFVKLDSVSSLYSKAKYLN